MTYIYIFLNAVARFQKNNTRSTGSSQEIGLHLQKGVLSAFSHLLWKISCRHLHYYAHYCARLLITIQTERCTSQERRHINRVNSETERVMRYKLN